MNFVTPLEHARSESYGSEFYCVYSVKARRIVTLFSKLEYYNFLVLETDPDVDTLCERPCQIDAVMGDESKKLVYDMWVRFKNGREELQKIKYAKDLNGDSASAIRAQEQIRRQKLWCEENGLPFVVLTENDLLRGEYLMGNCSVIAGLVRRYTPTDADYYNKLIIRYINDANRDGHKKVLMGELLNKELLPFGSEWAHIAYMHVNGMINLTIKNKPLDLKTEVRLHA